MEIKAIRGFNDILPEEIGKWQFVERTTRGVFEGFGFSEIRIPILEQTKLFSRGIGEATDIVEKEMYTFADRSGNSLTLRPEATASMARAYLEHQMYSFDPVAKLYCMGPMFRYERPQKGRYRQFYQIDAEVFGVANPMVDAEVIIMLIEFLKGWALRTSNSRSIPWGVVSADPDTGKSSRNSLQTSPFGCARIVSEGSIPIPCESLTVK